jgi:two-component system LytT family response regulator
MTGFRVLVADDEPLALTMVADLLKRDADVASVIECQDGAQVSEAIARHHPDIVFLDIEMPHADGIRIAETLRADGPVVVFITAFSKYAARAFDVRAVDYVVKPFSDGRFREALQRAKQQVRDRRLVERARAATAGPGEAVVPEPETGAGAGRLERLSLKEGDHTLVLKTAEIVWIEAQDYYVCVHSRRGRHLVRAALTALEGRLDPRTFVRVHRAAIVNLDEVQSVRDRDGMHLTLTDGTQVAVSRARRRGVGALLNPRLRSR